MINVSTAVQDAYINGNPDTKIFLTVGGTLYDPTNILAGSVSVIESLCSAECFTLSRVEKNELTFTLINTTENIKELQGKNVVAKQTITLNGVDTDIPLGTFQITEAVNDGDYLIKCTAYDKATLAFDENIDAWWNTTLTFPITIRNLAIALFTHLNVPYNIPATFTNSTYTLTTRPVYLEGVTAAELLGYIQEVVGGYFKADRYGVVRLFSTIDAIQGLRPRVGLYPRDNLFPRRTHSTFGNPDSYKQQDYSYPQIVGDLVISDYRTAEIEKVQVRGTEDDIGIIAGTGSNTYVIQGNPLLYNLTDATGRSIVTNILNEIKNVAYIPFSGKFMALPFLEAGDCAVITTYKGITAYAPIFKRTLSGTRLCFDTFECNGTKDIEQVFATNRSVKILNQKTHEIVNTVDELRSTVSSLDTEINGEDGLAVTVIQNSTDIEQNATAITHRATHTEAQGYATTAETNAKAYADQIVAGTVLIFYQASQPTTGMKTGDLWIDTTNGNELYRYDGSSWVSVQDDDIQTALSNAATAQSTADGKIKTFAQTTAPTASDVGDLWIDTDDNNKLWRWNGTAWVDVRDATIASASALAQNALDTANGKVTTYYQAATPTNASTGDLWIDTDDGNSLHRFNGSAWVDVDNADLATALQDAADAQATADSKIVTYAQTTAPTDGTVGDLWIDTDDNNTLYRHNGTAWVSVKDASIAAANSLAQSALDAANSKITTYYQASAPANASAGDLWIDTDDGNSLHRWSGTAWVDVDNTDIQAALTAAWTAQATADGKIVTFAQATEPAASVSSEGDLWIDTDDKNKMYRYSGSAWVAYRDTQITENATAITQNAANINIQAQYTGLSNLLVNSDFTALGNPTLNWKLYNVATAYESDSRFNVGQTAKRAKGKALKVTTTGGVLSHISQTITLNEEVDQDLYLILSAVGDSDDPNVTTVSFKVCIRIVDTNDTQLYFAYSTCTASTTNVLSFRLKVDKSYFTGHTIKTMEFRICQMLSSDADSVTIHINNAFATFSDTQIDFWSWSNMPKNDLISQINIAPDGVKISADKIDIYGITSFYDSQGNGSTTINGAEITVGGSNNQSGTITVKDASGNTIGTWDKDGINVTGGVINGTEIDSGEMYWYKGTANEAYIKTKNISYMEQGVAVTKYGIGLDTDATDIRGEYINIRARGKTGQWWGPGFSASSDACGISWMNQSSGATGGYVTVAETSAYMNAQGGEVAVGSYGVMLTTVDYGTSTLHTHYVVWRQVSGVWVLALA